MSEWQQRDHRHYPQLRSSLDKADDDAWRLRKNYLPALAVALRQAYALLHAATRRDDVYFAVYAALIPFRKMVMCAEQRLRVEYALALAYAGESADQQALEAVERALDEADELNDEVAPVELGYLAGSLAHRLNQQALAFGLYGDALDALRRLERDRASADPMLELDLTLRLGWRACELGRFPEGLRRLDEAYALRAHWPMTTPAHAASLCWLDAQVALARGNPARAVEMALPAAELLLEVGQALNAGRAHAFLSECAVGLAQSSLVDDPQVALGLAYDAARRAGALAREVSDQIGGEIARLAELQTLRAEMKRLSGSVATDSMSELARVLRVADKLGDIALIGRVEMAMGDELAGQGDGEGARSMLLRARQRFEEHDLGNLAFWSKRALSQLEEL